MWLLSKFWSSIEELHLEWTWVMNHFCFSKIQKQPSRGVSLSRSCSDNIRQIYRRTCMPKCALSWSSIAAYFQNTFFQKYLRKAASEDSFAKLGVELIASTQPNLCNLKIVQSCSHSCRTSIYSSHLLHNTKRSIYSKEKELFYGFIRLEIRQIMIRTSRNVTIPYLYILVSGKNFDLYNTCYYIFDLFFRKSDEFAYQKNLAKIEKNFF